MMSEKKRWLTPTTIDVVRTEEGIEKRKKYRESIGRHYVEGCLSEQVNNWPTPRAGNPGSRKPGTGGKVLGEEVKRNWPTASTSDAEGGRQPKVELTDGGFRCEKVNKPGNFFGAKLRDAVEMKEEKSSKLNANWCEQLMGLPVGWTQLSGETDPLVNRIDRLRLIGNGVVPQTAEVAFRSLMMRLI